MITHKNIPVSLQFSFIVLIISMLSCKTEGLECFKKSGNVTSVRRESGPYHTVRIEDNVDVFLLPDSSGPITVESGSQLLDGIETEVTEGVLKIMNTNTCNWMRDMKVPVRAYIPAGNIRKIDYKGCGNVSTTDTLNLTYFQLDIRDGSGSFNLLLHTDSTFLKIHEGVTDVTLSGQTAFCYIYNNGIGPVLTRDFSAASVVVHHKGPGKCMVRAGNSLDVSVEYSGNIYYWGNPAYIHSVVTGSGALIRMGY